MKNPDDPYMMEVWRNVLNDPLTLTDIQRDMIDFQIMHEKEDSFTVDDVKRLGEW